MSSTGYVVTCREVDLHPGGEEIGAARLLQSLSHRSTSAWPQGGDFLVRVTPPTPVGSLHPPRPFLSEQAKFVFDVCVASLNCRFSPGRLHPCPARAEVAMMAVSGSPAWVVRRGEPEVSAGGPQEG